MLLLGICRDQKSGNLRIESRGCGPRRAKTNVVTVYRQTKVWTKKEKKGATARACGVLSEASIPSSPDQVLRTREATVSWLVILVSRALETARARRAGRVRRPSTRGLSWLDGWRGGGRL